MTSPAIVKRQRRRAATVEAAFEQIYRRGFQAASLDTMLACRPRRGVAAPLLEQRSGPFSSAMARQARRTAFEG